MNKMLYVLLCSSVFLFSCERNVDDSAGKISVLLPLQNSILQDVLNPLSVVNSMSNGDDSPSEQFNTAIVPMFGSGATYPVNCYMIAVGSETSESLFSKNFCGKRSTITGRIDAEYKFGPFIGLAPAGADLELVVPAGEKRKVYVFAMHAQNPAACKTLTAVKGQNPSKENFSRPHLVGISATFSINAGQTTTVPITMIQPVAINSIEDCIIPSLDSEVEPAANRIVLERRNFPYDILSPGITGDTFPTNKRCDYLDVSPKYEFSDGASVRLKPAFLPTVKTAYISMVSTAQTTYTTKVNCENSNLGSIMFPIRPNDVSVRRWLQLDDTVNGIKTFRVDTSDASVAPFFLANIKMQSVRDPASTLSNGTQYITAKFDLVLPTKVIAGQCYPFFLTRKSLEDEPATHASIASSVTFSFSSGSAPNIFDDATCTTALGGSATIANGTYFGLYSFRAAQGFSIIATENGATFTTPVNSSKEYKVEIASASSSAQISAVEVSGSTFIRKRSVYNCYPITFKFKNEDGANIPTTSAAQIELLFGQIQDSLMGISFDANSICSGAPIISGSPTVTVPTGTHIFKIYVWVSLSAVPEWKTFRFKVFDGVKTHFLSYRFEVDAANY